MKKIISTVFVLIFSIVLVACGSGDMQTTSFHTENEGTKTELEYVYNDKTDRVATQKIRSELTYEYIELEDKNDAKATLEPTLDEYNDIEGVTYELEFKDDRVIETTDIDFDTLDFDRAQDIPGFALDGDPSDGISMKATTKALKAAGFSQE